MKLKTRLDIERRIVAKCVDDLLLAGFALSVYDGEETTVARSTDAKKIKAALQTTDEDWLEVLDVNGAKPKLVGVVAFVYGNDGWDVIADYHLSLERYLGEVNRFARDLERQYA